MPLRVKDWDRMYETAATRKRLRELKWVPVPNKHDGKGFRRLMATGGLEAFGAWVLILQVASKMPRRGVLQDEDGALTHEDIADAVGADHEAMRRAMDVLLSPRIAWLESVPDEKLSTETVENLSTENAGIPNLPKPSQPVPSGSVESFDDNGQNPSNLGDSWQVVADGGRSRQIAAENGLEEKRREEKRREGKASVIYSGRQPAPEAISPALNPIALHLADFAKPRGLPEPDEALIARITAQAGKHRAAPFAAWLAHVGGRKRELSWGLLATMVSDGDFDRWVRSRKIFA